jgi:type II secretory pathway component PulK
MMRHFRQPVYAKRRAIALPVILLLVLVAGIVISMMMERHVAQALSVQRELQQYSFHHSSKGAQEAIEAWLRYSGASRNMAEALDTDGHAFDLTLEDGSAISVSLFDGQDGVLIELAGLGTANRETARAIIEELQSRAGAGAARFVRREGPMQISANSAPPEVLAAAINAATEGEGTDNLVSEILHAREGEPLTQVSLADVFTQANVSPEIRPKLQTVLTAQPTLWRVIAETKPSGSVYIPGQRQRKFRGLVVLTGNVSGNPKDRAAALQRNSLITSWEEITDRQ